MPVSPLLNSEGVVNVQVSCDGRPVPDTFALVSLEVHEALGSIPSARLQFADGDMPEGRWVAADSDCFKPGAAIVVKAGYGNQASPLFEGIVVRLGAHIGADNVSTLVVDCRDKALRMTVGRRNGVYLLQSDSDILATLVRGHGLQPQVEATALQHGELVQYNCTDWDFLMTRADANGMLVHVHAGEVGIARPPAGGAAALKVGWGVELIEFHAELDARSQLQSVQASAWDPKTQAMLAGSAQSPASLPPLGNLDAKALSAVLGGTSFALNTSAALPQAELDGWGRAQQVKAALARVRGRMKFQGSALAVPTALIEVAGVGQRFQGSVLVTGVTQRIEDGNWSTEAEFGLKDDWFSQKPDVMGPAATGRLPGINGLHVGKVTRLDQDPEGLSRVQLSLPMLGLGAGQDVWARVMQFHASNGFGAFFVPEVGDEVVVAFFDGDPSAPVVLGSLYSSSRPPPYALAAENDTKAIVTRCKHRIVFDEKDKVITVTTPAGNQIVLSDKDKSIHVHDQNGNKVELSPSGILMSTPKDVKVSAQGSVSIDAVGPITLASKADVKSTGLNVACEAQVGFVGKGSATAELSAAGQTTVKGAMVMIN